MTATTFITACVSCGGVRFIIAETYVHDGNLDPTTGELWYKSWPQSGRIDRITCAECDAEFATEAFSRIEHS